MAVPYYLQPCMEPSVCTVCAQKGAPMRMMIEEMKVKRVQCWSNSAPVVEDVIRAEATYSPGALCAWRRVLAYPEELPV